MNECENTELIISLEISQDRLVATILTNSMYLIYTIYNKIASSRSKVHNNL